MVNLTIVEIKLDGLQESNSKQSASKGRSEFLWHLKKEGYNQTQSKYTNLYWIRPSNRADIQRWLGQTGYRREGGIETRAKGEQTTLLKCIRHSLKCREKNGINQTKIQERVTKVANSRTGSTTHRRHLKELRSIFKLMTAIGHGITQHGTHKRQGVCGQRNNDKLGTCSANEVVPNTIQSLKKHKALDLRRYKTMKHAQIGDILWVKGKMVHFKIETTII